MGNVNMKEGEKVKLHLRVLRRRVILDNSSAFGMMPDIAKDACSPEKASAMIAREE